MAATEDAPTIVSEEVKSPWLLTDMGSLSLHLFLFFGEFRFCLLADLDQLLDAPTQPSPCFW
jgi:hypothetical protein